MPIGLRRSGIRQLTPEAQEILRDLILITPDSKLQAVLIEPPKRTTLADLLCDRTSPADFEPSEREKIIQKERARILAVLEQMKPIAESGRRDWLLEERAKLAMWNKVVKAVKDGQQPKVMVD